MRALNLFFNGKTSPDSFLDFKNDFFKKEKLDHDDTVQKMITIKITFINSENKEKNSKNDFVRLPAKFWVSRKFIKTSRFSSYSETNGVETSFKKEKKEGKFRLDKYYDYKEGKPQKLKQHMQASLSRQLSLFLDSIYFHYVPAIKDQKYFSFLYGELQKTLLKEKDTKVDIGKKEFQGALQNSTEKLMEEFKNVVNNKQINISPAFELPNLIDLFKSLVVQTGKNIELKYRGDGIQAKLIPEILNFIAVKELTIKKSKLKKGEKTKKYFIWGFEESENSYEYKNAQILADKFKDIFIDNAQIFLTTHSFNFLSINGENVSIYRVWKDDKIESSMVLKVKKENNKFVADENYDGEDFDLLNEELGFLQLSQELEKLYDEKAQLNEEEVRRLKKEINEVKKPILYVEDEFYQIYQIAYLKLNNIDFDKKNLKQKFDEESDFKIYSSESSNELRKKLDSVNIDDFNDKKIIGLFDFDSAYSQFNGLKKERWYEIKGEEEKGLYRNRKNNENFKAMVLPIPSHRENFASKSLGDKSLLEIELLFEDECLKDLKCLSQEKIPATDMTRSKFSGNKSNFWEKLIDLDKEYFKHFKTLFDEIKEFFKD